MVVVVCGGLNNNDGVPVFVCTLKGRNKKRYIVRTGSQWLFVPCCLYLVLVLVLVVVVAVVVVVVVVVVVAVVAVVAVVVVVAAAVAVAVVASVGSSARFSPVFVFPLLYRGRRIYLHASCVLPMRSHESASRMTGVALCSGVTQTMESTLRKIVTRHQAGHVKPIT